MNKFSNKFIGFDTYKSIFETEKYYKNVDDEDLKLIDDLFNYLSSNNIKYSKTDLKLLSTSIFLISRITDKKIYEILEDLEI